MGGQSSDVILDGARLAVQFSSCGGILCFGLARVFVIRLDGRS
jgi:hypothetical protein